MAQITALVENISYNGAKSKHGLSLYIETKKHKILFDVGPDKTLFINAKIKGINLSEVDTVIISHGHFDHGGALEEFLKVNNTAKIYVQRKAFDKHYSKFLCFNVSVGIDEKLKDNKQVVLVDGDYEIDDELSLFITNDNSKCYSKANDSLYIKEGKDNFLHEQNLIINEDKKILLIGCGHAGIVNIMEKAEKYSPKICIGGYHLFNPLTKRTVSEELLDEIISKLKKYDDIEFYTCHCTGKKAYNYMSKKMNNMHYISCTETIH